MVTTGCTGILRLARAFTRATLRMTEGERITVIADIAGDRENPWRMNADHEDKHYH
jgi:UDP-N-acetylmuramyl tripeptide synthase